MRIKEIRVHRYGPLADFVLIEPDSFTLLFGPNESGKTLLLDAILRFLLRRQREQALFWDRDRVEHDPDGFVEIEHGDQGLRFPDVGSLSDVLDIQAEDLRNILVVRASDLHVQQGQQKEYYAALTDRLMGIHREAMRKIADKLRDIGRLTPGGALSDAQANEKMLSRFEEAQELLDDIQVLMGAERETDLVDLERQLIQAEEQATGATQELELLQGARERELYTTACQQVDELTALLEEIRELPTISDDDYNRWRDSVRQIEDAERGVEAAQAELAELEEVLAQAGEQAKEADDRLKELQRRQPAVQTLGDEVRPYRNKLEAGAGRGPLMVMAPRTTIIFGLLALVSLLAALLQPAAPALQLASVILIFFLVLSAGLWVWGAFQAGRTRREWEHLRLEATELGMQADTLEELLEALRRFSDDLERARSEQAQAESERNTAQVRVESKQDEIESFRDTIQEAESTLAQLREDLGLETFDEVKRVRDQLSEKDKRKDKIAARLDTQFGEAPGELDEQIEIWRARVEELEQFADAAPDVEMDESREKALRAKVEELEETVEGVREQLQQVRSQISDLARAASRVLQVDEDLPGDTFEDLRAVERALGEFVEEVDERARLAGKAIDILESIQAEEEQRVKELFGEEDLASQYFRSITNESYQRIDYDPQNGELKVVRANEEILSAYKLSTGTYDQLYLATRLSLAERLLGGEPGFLLLDDPFLTSDSRRLVRQLEILLELAKEGWQIVYFSVKQEVLDQLSPAIEAEIVRKEEMAPMA